MRTYAKARQLSVEKFNAACADFKTLHNDRVISPSKSVLSSPLNMVTKQNGEDRFCGDSYSLNGITRSDRFSMPNTISFSAKLAKKERFSKIGLISPYPPPKKKKKYQDASGLYLKKTASINLLGFYEYNAIWILKNTSTTFPTLYRQNFQRHCVFVYIDILIFSNDEISHKKHCFQYFTWKQF